MGPDGLTWSESRLGTVSAILSPLPDGAQREAALAGRAESLIGIPGLSGAPVLSVVGPADLLGFRWSAVAEIETAEVLAEVRSAVARLIVKIALSILLVAIVALAVSRTITLPLSKVRKGIQQVAEGNYDINMRAADRGDEIGGIAATVLSLRDRLAKSDELERERVLRQQDQRQVVEALTVALGALSRGDMTCQIDAAFPSEYEQLRTDFNSAVGQLAATLEAVTENASRIRTGAGEIAQASDDLSRRTETQAATLEQTAAALDELTQSVRSAAEGAREVEGIVEDAKVHATQSGTVVQSAVSAMTAIERSSDQIGQIIGVIDDIAFQTNLLALNAGVEAARAGEAGKGFAVVASEVRALAQRSSEAAREIKDLISDSSAQVQEGVDLVGQAGGALTSIVDRVGHISELVTGIARGTVEQAQGLGEINTGVMNLDQVTQQNAAMVEQSTAAAHSLTAEANTLAQSVGAFTLPDGVRARPRPVAVPDLDPRPPAARAAGAAPQLAVVPAGPGGPAGDTMWQDF